MDPVRFSRLKKMALSPAHYAANIQPTSRAIGLGRAVHSMVLGGPPVVAFTGAVRRGKEWEKFRDDHADAIIVTQDERDTCSRMADAVDSHSEARRVLTGRHEVPIAWEYCGRACVSTPDCIGETPFGDTVIADIKTCQTSHPGRFGWHALRMLYHAQLAFYRLAAGGARDCYLVAVEATPPHPVTVHRLTERALDIGERMCRGWMERLLQCEAANYWPGYCDAVNDLDVPDDDLIFAEEEAA